MKEYFGIDFGTTNSTVVGRLKRNTTKYGDGEDRPYPSLVAISKTTGEVAAVGREAWDSREELSDYCEIISSAKMLLGSDTTWKIGPVLWTPELVVAELFNGLISSVDTRAYDSALEDPVIAIPVGFSPEKRKALRRAAANAGLKIRQEFSS